MFVEMQFVCALQEMKYSPNERFELFERFLPIKSVKNQTKTNFSETIEFHSFVRREIPLDAIAV